MNICYFAYFLDIYENSNELGRVWLFSIRFRYCGKNGNFWRDLCVFVSQDVASKLEQFRKNWRNFLAIIG